MPPPDLHSRSPRPKSSSSSSGLLGAFRSLTGQRKGQATISAASTPSPPSHPLTQNPGSVLEHGKAPLKRGVTEPANVTLTAETVSADLELESNSSLALREIGTFAAGLRPGRDAKERRNAALSATDFLQQRRIDNVGQLWHTASDLLDDAPDSPNFQAGLSLYKACIQQEDLKGPDLRQLFETMAGQLLAIPQECIKCLDTLTRHGRELKDLDPIRVSILVAKLVKSSSEAASDARRRIRKENSGSSAPEDACLEQTLDLVTNAFKFCSTLFNEAQLDMILNQLFIACRKTSLEIELSGALGVFDALVTYCIIGGSILRPLLEILCGVYCSVESLVERAEAVLWKIMRSYHAPAAIAELQSILTEGSRNDDTMVNSVRGAVMVLHRVFTSNTEGISANISLVDLIGAMSQSLSLLDVNLERDVLDVLQDLMLRQDVFTTVLTDEVWPGFAKLIARCASSEAMNRCKATEPPLMSLNEVQNDTGEPPRSQSEMSFMEAFQKLTQNMLQNEPLQTEVSTLTSDSVMSVPVDDRKNSIVPVLLKVATSLDEITLEKALNYCDEEKLHTPPHDHWLDTCNSIRLCVLQDTARAQNLRLVALKLLKESYSIAVAFNSAQSDFLLIDLLNCITDALDLSVLRPLLILVVEVASWTNNQNLFKAIIGRMQHVLLENETEPNTAQELTTLRVPNVITSSNHVQSPPDTPALLIAQSLVRVFLRTVHRSYAKSNQLYTILLSISQSTEPPAEARIAALKVLVRLRADINYGIFVVPRTECDSMAAALCRTADSAVLAHISADSPATPAMVEVKIEENVSRRRERGESSNNTSLSRSNSSAGRSTNQPSRLTQATPPLWMYPGPKGVPEEPYYFASHVTYAHTVTNLSDQSSEAGRKGSLDIGIWLEVVVQMINSPTVNWEIFSYVIVHLGSQLANHALFINAIPQIKLLRRTICEKLSQRNYIEPPAYSNLKKSDAAICLYDILTMLISYAGHFNKDEEQDAIVKAFVLGIGSWERTSETCIHGLTICCHEIPSVLVRYLDTALHRMSQIITQTNIAASILDFLATLARLPQLFRNFREEEFKTVFGICFRYLQSVRDVKEKQLNQPTGRVGRTAVAGLKSTRDLASPVDSRLQRNTLGEALPQYVYALTYHVMTFWFMALKLQDRPKHISWITKNLTNNGETGVDSIEEQAQVTVDMMHRVAYSDRDETAPDTNFALPADGQVSIKHFLLGMSILSVETAGRTGVSQLTMRRSTGTTYSIYRPLIAALPKHQAAINIGLAADAYYSADYVGVTPDHIIQTLYSPLYTAPELMTSAALPVALPEDDSIRRAITTFDRIPALDGHKAGIIYVGEGQKDDVAILANVMGSADYMEFLNGIGTLTELRGATINTQGLDREFDTDGKFTYCWRDRVTELVFHVTTMMPTNLEHDPQCALKKRHIGNDFVNIVFNNSGSPFDFETFRSDFNYVNIVITPEARASFVETRVYAARLGSDDTIEQPFYKVTVLTKPGLPSISAAAETKIISASALPAFVRLMALNASVFSNVWANRETGEHSSSWKSRLLEIKRIRSRNASSALTAPWAANMADAGSPPPTGSSAGEQQSTNRNSGLLRRASAATFLSDSGSTKRNSGMSGVGDVDHE